MGRTDGEGALAPFLFAGAKVKSLLTINARNVYGAAQNRKGKIMGKIYDALLKKKSSHRAKKEGLWDSLIGRLEDCQTRDEVGVFQEYLSLAYLEIPGAWEEPLAEAIEKKMEEILVEEEVLAGRFYGR